jgi:hypothetical protein
MDAHWVVAVDWIDGDVEDCDEVAVTAPTELEAIELALLKWLKTTAGGRATGATVLTPENILESI